MATNTAAQLAVAVLERIGAKDLNQPSISATVSQSIIRAYQRKLATLVDDDLAYWSEDAIPDEAFEAMVNIMAQQVAPGLGRPIPTEESEAGRVRQVGGIGMDQLRKHVRRRATGLPTQIEPF